MPSRLATDLVRHPSTGAQAVRRLEVDANRLAEDRLLLRYRLSADLRLIRVPSPRPPRRGDRLWEHTCFEAFVGLAEGTAYHELNFSPSGEWAVYLFRGYRDRVEPADAAIDVRIDDAAADALLATALVPLARLSPRYRGAPLRIGLSAVIEATDGARSYWALRHADGAPDFHRAQTWTAWLEPPTAEC